MTHIFDTDTSPVIEYDNSTKTCIKCITIMLSLRLKRSGTLANDAQSYLSILSLPYEKQLFKLSHYAIDALTYVQ